jgi:hypothetical protein
MISALSGGEGLGSSSSIYLAQQLQGVNGSTVLSSLTGSQQGAGVRQSSATISGPGQLLSDLQQLQAQDPTKFTQVVSDITSQLQAASQQAQGPQSNFLSNLSARFQSVASGGSLAQLQPHQHSHHHSHAQAAYSQVAQSQPEGIAGLAQPSSSQSSGSATMQQLFTSISTEVSQALQSR